MKRFILVSVLIASFFMLKTADAQVRVNINLNSQPLWGPVGYNYVEYYYLPDINVYYHVSSRKFTYYNGKRWLTTGYLPKRVRYYNLYNGYKVVVNEQRPWIKHHYYVANYSRYRGHRGQETIKAYNKHGKKQLKHHHRKHKEHNRRYHSHR